MKILAIDPGCTESQLIVWNGERVVANEFRPNAELLALLAVYANEPCRICIEMVACYGMAVGKEVFETCVWIGRFQQELISMGFDPLLIYRQEVKLHLCQSPRAKDANIRQALIDRFGGKAAAIGLKKTPGPLYGISSHAWAALALAITLADNPR